MHKACSHCDLLQVLPSATNRARFNCAQCDFPLATFERPHPERDAALAIASLIVLGIANTFPILSLELNGRRLEATILDGVGSMWQQQRYELALLILLVAVLAPVAHASCVLIRSHAIITTMADKHIRRWTLWSAQLAPWSMTEVYLLGALVAFVKLDDLAAVVVGPALYALGLMCVLTAWSATHTRVAWTALHRD